MYDEIWLVVRTDDKDIHKTSYNSRTIRAYKTESKAKTQAKLWNKPFQVLESHGFWKDGVWTPPKYKMIDPGELYIVVKYVPASE